MDENNSKSGSVPYVVALDAVRKRQRALKEKIEALRVAYKAVLGIPGLESVAEVVRNELGRVLVEADMDGEGVS